MTTAVYTALIGGYEALEETVGRQHTRARTLQERLEQQRERRRELERMLFDGVGRRQGREG